MPILSNTSSGVGKAVNGYHQLGGWQGCERLQVEQVIILNKKQHTDTAGIVLPTRYEDGHYLVSIAISGNGKFWKTLEMLIDTGADFIVLPESMIAGLGMANTAFSTRKIQTANGEIDAKVAPLQEVNIAAETLTNVDAGFYR